MSDIISALSPLIKEEEVNRLEHEVTIGGTSLRDIMDIMSIEITLEINKVAIAVIEVAEGNHSKNEFKHQSIFEPGKEVEIKLGYKLKPKTIFKGIVSKTNIKIKDESHSAISIHCSDKAVKMTLNRKNELYKDKKDSDVVQEIAGKYGLSPDVKATKVQHKKLVQYYATDWDFCLARAEHNGMVVTTEQNKFIMQPPEVSGDPSVALTFGEDIIKTDINLDMRNQYKKVECSAWDHTKQQLIKAESSEPTSNSQGSISGSKMADAMGGETFKMHLTGPVTKDDLKEWANSKLLKSRLSRIRGSISFQGNKDVKPNKIIKIEKISPYFEGDAYITKVVHEVSDGNWTTEATLGTSPEAFTQEKSTDIRMPHASGQMPGISGLYNGVVKKIDADDDGDLRVLVDVPVINEGGAGLWARLANLYATNNAGSFFYPEIGDEVLVGFLQGDPRFPIIIGSIYGKKHKAPYEPDSTNKVKAIVSREQLKIIFKEDKKDIVIETPAGNRITLTEDKKKIIIEDQNKNLIEMSPSGIKIDTPKDITMTAKGKIKIEAMMDVSIKGTTGFKIEGLKGDIKADTQLTAKGSAMAEFSSSGMTMVKGSMVMIN
ncbi:MAG: type secretion system tip protein VgrG [Bacteroidota bacterium]|jgi:Rhs element Vgr protein